jgi:hypothetical protein
MYSLTKKSNANMYIHEDQRHIVMLIMDDINKPISNSCWALRNDFSTIRRYIPSNLIESNVHFVEYKKQKRDIQRNGVLYIPKQQHNYEYIPKEEMLRQH